MAGTAITKLSSKGQVVIPGKIREILKLKEGTLFVVENQDNNILLKKIEVPGTKKYEKLNINDIKKKIISTLKKNHVIKAGIFGSYARGEQKKKSDVDILVKINKKASLFDVIALKLELEKVIGKGVDLGEYESIKSIIKKDILKEEVRII